MILWIHGLGESGRCFDQIAAHPALRGFPAMAPDLPGYGHNDPQTPPRSLESVADHLAEMLIDKVVVVGHSMGGIIGMSLAERHPELIRLLVNVEGNVSSADCVYSGRAAKFSEAEFALRGMSELIAFVDENALTDDAHRGYAERIRQADPATFHAHSRELVAISASEEVPARLLDLAVPLVYVAGSPRGVCARSMELLQKAAAPIVEIAPSGHWPFIDQPDRFALALSDLLE